MSRIAERVAAKFLEIEAAKLPTFQAAQAAIMALLEKERWKVTRGLKIPYATSPSGELRLWFKAQAVYFTEVPDPRVARHEFGAARTLSYDLDIRTITPEQFLSLVTGHFRSAR